MKRFLVSACALALVVTSLGCSNCNCPKCRSGSGLLSRNHRGAGAGAYGDVGGMGPGGAVVAYPYYTTRGPRDFLARNPQGIGP